MIIINVADFGKSSELSLSYMIYTLKQTPCNNNKDDVCTLMSSQSEQHLKCDLLHF